MDRSIIDVRPGPPGLIMAAVSDPNMVLAEVKDEVMRQIVEADPAGIDQDLVLADSLVVNVMFGDYVLDDDEPDGLYRPSNPIERNGEWWNSTMSMEGDWSKGGRMFIFCAEGFDVYNMIEALVVSGRISESKGLEIMSVVARALGDNALADLVESDQ